MEDNNKPDHTFNYYNTSLNQNEDKVHYELKLYITGMTPNSVRAVNNIKTICKSFFNNNYTLEIIDVYQNPALAAEENIIVTPTLIKKSPEPVYRVVGNLSDTEKVLHHLGINIK